MFIRETSNYLTMTFWKCLRIQTIYIGVISKTPAPGTWGMWECNSLAVCIRNRMRNPIRLSRFGGLAIQKHT